MGIKKEQILFALRHVDDPDLKKDLVTLNMIRDVEVDGMKVSLRHSTKRNSAKEWTF